MHVTFGMHADGGAWPEHGGAGSASFGAPVVGPGGLLGLLEGALGLAGPDASELERVVAWQAALTAVDGERRFWHRSLATDAWATARLLLGWRDDLVRAGWGAGAWQGARLADLAAAEEAAQAANPARGTADRLRAVERHLNAVRRAPFPTLEVIGRRSDLPAPWRRLIAALADAGVRVTERVPFAAAAPHTSLGRLQRWLLGEAHDAAPLADDTVVWARTISSATAGELVAGWSAAWPQGRSVAFVAGDDAFALDAALHAAGQPRLGAAAASPYRGGLQVLRLAFQVAWRPIDVRALLALLTLPQGPVPEAAARTLANTLSGTPGFGGAWQRAWGRVAEAERARSGDATVADAHVDLWRAWIEPPPADPEIGLPASDALSVCARVSAWANEAGRQATAAVAADVEATIRASKRALLPKAWLDRLIEQALERGTRDPVGIAEAAPARRAVAHPGAIWAAADAVVWWNYRDDGERLPRAPWSAAERAELVRGGCDLDAIAHAATATSAAWERAVLHARERLVLISTGSDVDAHEAHHPLAHRLQPGFARWGTVVRLDDAFARASFPFAGATLPRVPVEARAVPTAAAAWATPAGFRARAHGRHESATTLSSLLACPLQWALKHVAQVRPGRTRSLPKTEQLLGTLAHALAEAVFPPGEAPTPEEASAAVTRALGRLVDAHALPLRLPTQAIEYTQATRLLPRALAKLAETLRANGLQVVGTEERIDTDAPPLRGSIDLVADAPAGPVVVDLKWTRSPKRRRKELRDGHAVQLATYAAALRARGDDRPARAGYFLLRQGVFLTTPDAGLMGSVVPDARGMAATWEGVVAGWAAWLGATEEGTLHARGVATDAPATVPAPAIALEPSCRYCDFQVLCRTKVEDDA